MVTILESPEAIIHIESDTLSIINPTAFFKGQPENNTFNYDWNFGDNTSNTSSSVVHTFPIDEDGLGILGIYETSLIVTDGNGCSDTAVKPIWVRDEYWIYIPNSFTPNFDEKHRNEKFCLEYHAIRENTFLFKVFNTQGDLMFQSANPLGMKCSNKAGWDGKHYETQKELPADKQQELKLLKQEFNASTESDLKFDALGRVRAIYDAIALSGVDHHVPTELATKIEEITLSYPNLFGIGDSGDVLESKVTCSDDICATKLSKSFYGLPAWDHELSISTKANKIFAITGNFYAPSLGAPKQYLPDQSKIRSSIARYFSKTTLNIIKFFEEKAM